MDALQAILSRRSIRAYTRQPVADADVADLLAAAMNAPSAGNEQPWHFIVIRDRQRLAMIPRLHPHSRMVPDASAAILVCGDLNLEQHPGFWVQDCSAATQNILIAAHAKGLGAVWLGIYPRPDRVESFKEAFDLPEHVIPFALIPIGYPAEHKTPNNNYDPARVHFDQW